jgi:hypothetical protein
MNHCPLVVLPPQQCCCKALQQGLAMLCHYLPGGLLQGHKQLDLCINSLLRPIIRSKKVTAAWATAAAVVLLRLLLLGQHRLLHAWGSCSDGAAAVLAAVGSLAAANLPRQPAAAARSSANCVPCATHILVVDTLLCVCVAKCTVTSAPTAVPHFGHTTQITSSDTS